MKTLNLLLGTIFFSLLLTSCDKDDDNNFIACDKQVVISADEYNTAPSDHLTVTSLEIDGDCLKIKFGSGGCSGDTWELKLIDSEAVLESDPPQRNLRLSLRNEELCEAYITKELAFDISILQVDGNQVLLNITNSDDQILYEY